MRVLAVNTLLIVAAAAGIMLLLKKGGDAGVRKLKQVTSPASRIAEAPRRPHAIQGQIDDFNAPIMLEPVQAWGSKAKYGFLLGAPAGSNPDRSRARLTFTRPPAEDVVLEIDYTIPQTVSVGNAPAADANGPPAADASGASTNHGIQLTTDGASNSSCALLQGRPQDQKWLSYNLVVPSGTKHVQFWIAGLPRHYDRSPAEFVISLPQLQVIPGNSTATPYNKPTPDSATHN